MAKRIRGHRTWRGLDAGRVLADAIDGPVGVAPMTGRHVFGDDRVLVVCTENIVRVDDVTKSLKLAG
jgi:hypothetical protein